MSNASDSSNGSARRAWQLPSVGGDPSRHGAGTTPGSFANVPNVGDPLAFSSPDTPGMPSPSDKTAWDFMPEDWTLKAGRENNWHKAMPSSRLRASTPTWAPRRSRAAPTKRSRSCAGPSAGAPTP